MGDKTHSSKEKVRPVSDTTNPQPVRPLSPLDELVRDGARQLLQRALELEVDAVNATLGN